MAVQNPPRNGERDHAKRGGGGSQSLHRPQVYAARKLRREMTLPEVLLWEQLRAQKLGVEMPITETVVALLDGSLPVRDVVSALMGREPKSE